MQLARERIEENNWVLDCPYMDCNKPNWEYVGVRPIQPGQEIRAADFRGLGSVPRPVPGQEIDCYFCGRPMLIDTSRPKGEK